MPEVSGDARASRGQASLMLPTKSRQLVGGQPSETRCGGWLQRLSILYYIDRKILLNEMPLSTSRRPATVPPSHRQIFSRSHRNAACPRPKVACGAATVLAKKSMAGIRRNGDTAIARLKVPRRTAASRVKECVFRRAANWHARVA